MKISAWISVLLAVCLVAGCSGGGSGPAPDKAAANKLMKKGVECQNNGDNQKALQYFNKAIEKNPGTKKGYMYRAMLYESMGDLEKAISDFKKVAKRDQSDFYSVQQIANLYRRLGDDTKAEEYEAKAQERQQAAMSQTRSNIEQAKKDREKRRK